MGGLVKQPALNGKEANVVKKLSLKVEAYEVKMADTGEVKKLKRDNLIEPLAELDSNMDCADLSNLHLGSGDSLLVAAFIPKCT